MAKSKSRATRFEDAQTLVSQAKDEFETLRDELQEWYDNLPENFQQGSKGEALQEAIQELENAIEGCGTAEDTVVNFPGMYG